jgi:hypothetical protein
MLMWFLIQKNYIEKSPKKDLSLVMGPSQIILGMVIFRKRMMHNNKKIWKTCYCLLPKPTCLFLLYLKLVVEALDHASESLSCVFKPQANGSTCHPFIRD